MHFLLDDTLAEDLIHSGVYFSAVRNNELSLREESVLWPSCPLVHFYLIFAFYAKPWTF